MIWRPTYREIGFIKYVLTLRVVLSWEDRRINIKDLSDKSRNYVSSSWSSAPEEVLGECLVSEEWSHGLYRENTIRTCWSLVSGKLERSDIEWHTVCKEDKWETSFSVTETETADVILQLPKVNRTINEWWNCDAIPLGWLPGPQRTSWTWIDP